MRNILSQKNFHEYFLQTNLPFLRGSFATISLRNGCEIKDIAEVLGHKRIETTEKYYISSTIDTLKNVSETFEKEIDLNNFIGINCKKQ